MRRVLGVFVLICLDASVSRFVGCLVLMWFSSVNSVYYGFLCVVDVVCDLMLQFDFYLWG